ncbi:hypothetical protein TWF696_007626 [Orbilia brochopaga]|uniref:F-box domain-containing protein n=1 Tax=Orbilia brochopaga TaxID=3140254 RepID=A0AAV9UP58_9PEZI
MKSLSDLPYDVLLNICQKLDAIRAEARKQPGNPPPAVDIPCECSRCLHESRFEADLPPATRRDSPRRAKKYALEEVNRAMYLITTGAMLPMEGSNPSVYKVDVTNPDLFRSESIFDGLSRANKLLREICVPFLFRSVVLASDDCLTLDRLEFYNQAEWILEHVRCVRFLIKDSSPWPREAGVSGETHSDILPTAVASAVQLLTSIPNLQSLNMSIEPSSFRDLFKRTLLPLPSSTPPEFFPKVTELYIRVGCEFIIPLCGADVGLKILEYDVPNGCEEMVSFKIWEMRPEEPFGGIENQHALAMLTGLQKLPNNKLRKVSIGGRIDNSGLECMIPFISQVRELSLSEVSDPFLSQDSAHLFRRLPRIRKLRLSINTDPGSGVNPFSHIHHSDLLAVLANTPHMTEVWYTDRFVCRVPRKVVDGVVQINLRKVFWRDTWAPNGIWSSESLISTRRFP